MDKENIKKKQSQEAKRYLNQVRLFDIHINRKIEDADKIKELMTKITTTIKSDVVSSGGSQDKIGDGVSRLVDLENEINAAVDRYVDRKNKVGDIIEMLCDPDYVDILYKRYFNYEKWPQIAVEIGRCERQTTRIHGDALLAFYEVMKKEGLTNGV